VPRGSTNRAGITAYLKQWAESNGFQVVVDQADNLLVTVPATKGMENVPGICFQGHTDMVCVKTPESQHDFLKDPISLRIDGEWLKATDTTLGADDGIGLALAMALARHNIAHGPIELLFTSDEEIGLIGAMQLKPCIVSKYLISLDGGFNSIGNSCAGAF